MDFSRTKKYEYNPFQKYGHACTIQDDLIDPVLLVISEDVKCSRMRRAFGRFRTVSENNVMAQNRFRSQFAIEKEQFKHLSHYPFMIHPASQFRSWWEGFMIINYLFCLILTPVYFLCGDFESSGILPFIMEFFCLVDIAVTFFTGLQNRRDFEACLDFSIVARKYLRGTFFIDLLSWLPLDYVTLVTFGPDAVFCDVFLVLKLIRIVKLLKYVDNFAERMNIQLVKLRLTKLTIVVVVYITWVTFLQFIVAYLFEGTSLSNAKNENSSWITFFGVKNATSNWDRFFVALFRSTMLITLQGLGEEFPLTFTDQLFAMFVWTTSLSLTTYVMAIAVSMVVGVKSSKSQYHLTIQQLKAFTERKDLPKYLENKLLWYYELRYHKSFFSESDILESVSGRLLQDVIMHSCRNAVENVPFLKHLPDDMLVRIVSLLHSEIFLPNEVIVNVDSSGDCMYFILTGTVAVYSSGGKELCHLQDGAHFGEVAILGGARGRAASAVALRPCELLRLDGSEFCRAAARHPELLEGIMRIAADRVEQTFEIDRIDNA